MRRCFQLVWVLALTVALAAPAWAQQSATVVLRSGERLSAELVDLGGAGFTFRVGGATRQVPTGDVAVIDFAGGAFPSSEVNQIAEGKHLIVLNSGETISGNLYDVSGASPKRITIDTPSGRRDLRSTDIRRIYLARPTGSGTTGSTGSLSQSSAALPATGGQIRVPANQRWTDTGITVRKGDRVSFNASGQVQLSGTGGDTASPAGAANGRYPSGPMPRVLAGALIGRVGPVALFGIGNQTTALTMPADGRLFLGVNDDQMTDNQGEFTVDVRPESPVSPRR